MSMWDVVRLGEDLQILMLSNAITNAEMVIDARRRAIETAEDKVSGTYCEVGAIESCNDLAWKPKSALAADHRNVPDTFSCSAMDYRTKLIVPFAAV
jgi:hypothetical protein